MAWSQVVGPLNMLENWEFQSSKVFLTIGVAKYPGLKPDVIAFWHVLEHVHDPVGFLADVASLLRPRWDRAA